MKQTPVIAEIQATQEYLGQAKHLVYLGTMWKEFLDSDTHAKGSGSTVAKVLAGKVYPSRLTGMVSVTNPGLDTNWCGHHFSQSNWYAFGRLAWNPELSAEKIADEWTRMTFTNDDKTVAVIRDMMMCSRETYRELHDASGAASSDRRRPLRADALEQSRAEGRLDSDLLSSGFSGRHRLRPNEAR